MQFTSRTAQSCNAQGRTPLRARLPLIGAFYLSCAVIALAGNVSSAEGDLRGSTNIVPHEAPLARDGAEPGTEVATTLLTQLRSAPNVETAKAVEGAIWKVWLKSGSDTADLLMAWAVESIAEKNYDRAVQYLDAVIEMRPTYAEAWNKRATVHYMRDDYARSLGDLRHVLALEPRHFGALAGLGNILQEIGDKSRALDAYRRATAIHPHFENAKKAIDRLTIDVEGRDI